MLRYIVRLERDGARLASFPCENDSHVLEVVNDLLAGTLDAEDNIRIDRHTGADGPEGEMCECCEVREAPGECGHCGATVCEECHHANECCDGSSRPRGSDYVKNEGGGVNDA